MELDSPLTGIVVITALPANTQNKVLSALCDINKLPLYLTIIPSPNICTSVPCHTFNKATTFATLPKATE
jgi:hypothetical protein